MPTFGLYSRSPSQAPQKTGLEMPFKAARCKICKGGMLGSLPLFLCSSIS